MSTDDRRLAWAQSAFVSLRRVVGDERGALMVEYIVTVACGLIIAAALVTIGPAMVQAYLTARHTVIIPIP